jgi:pimeloyl-ACP methyl ester carboxylesterase
MVAISSADRASAPLIILIHGFAASKDIGVIPLLFERFSMGGSSVIAFDLTAHGGTAGAFESVTPDSLERDIDVIIDEHGDDRPIVLIGHSLGGVLAYRVALRRADVARAVLLAPGFSIASRFLIGLRSAAMRDGSASFVERGREYRVSKAFFERSIDDPLASPEPLDKPTLIIVGEFDVTISRTYCERLADHLPDARFALAYGEGHDLTGLSYWSWIGSFLDRPEE